MVEAKPTWRGFSADARRLPLSCLWFFLVLFSYYCLKPLRDALGTDLSEQLGRLYLGTFISTLVALAIYSFLVSRLSRRWLLFSVHQFFAACLVGFYLAIPELNRCPPALIAVFFVWVSVFNLNVVTLFWSAMADLFSKPDAKKWFGTMAAAGSIGSVSGSYIASLVAGQFDPRILLLVAIAALELAVVVGWSLINSESARDPTREVSSDRGTGGSIWAGLTRVIRSQYLIAVCAFVVLGKFAATFIYNLLQNQLNVEMPDAHARTELFSHINLYSQLGSFLMQFVAVGLLIRWLGVGLTLALPCATYGCLFVWLVNAPNAGTLAQAHIIQQIVSYGILVPAQHLLFTVVSREDKYKAKSFIDTVVFRGSDVAAANTCSAITRLGATTSLVAAAMAPLTLVWLFVGLALGRAFRDRSSNPNSGAAE